jgi:NAD(P)-dependent dehydrogenase (short-subunit alcohol dehydrogenase family)/acyl dehydratase/acyl carrier protein
MAAATYSIDSFEVGDWVTFERAFTPRDFASFRELSGDSSPLHHDAAYASATPFQQPIVPLHLTLAPLSMVAGMVFPGEPALYLSHEVRAAQPVHYADVIRYSARVEAVNRSHQVLALRILGVRGADVVLDATMRVQCRQPQWSTPPALLIRKGTKSAIAVVTGATGEIGRAIAVSLAKAGWELLLQHHQDGTEKLRLKDTLEHRGARATFIQADLTTPAGRAALAAAVSQTDDLGLIVHAASPPVSAALDDLVSVNFLALKQVVDAALPRLLPRQKSAIVLVGSTAVEHTPPGWESYAGAKAMAATYVNGIERAYAGYGLRGLQLLTGLVATRFSAEYRGTAPALLPQEVAEALLQLIDDRRNPENTLRLDLGGCTRGRFGFYTNQKSEHGASQAAPAALGPTATRVPVGASENGRSPAAAVICKLLQLPAEADLTNAGLGTTPGWDSLKHIELLLSLEASLGIHFDSSEMSHLQRFSQLDPLCRKKVAEKGRR